MTLEAKVWAKATLWTAAAAFTGFIASEPRVKLQQGLRQLPLRFIHSGNKPLAAPLTRISLDGRIGYFGQARYNLRSESISTAAAQSLRTLSRPDKIAALSQYHE